MKKKIMAILAMALVLTMIGAQALAATGDLTVKSVKVYSDAEMKNCIGTLPAMTSLLVRSYDSFADIYIDGKICYIDASALLHKNIASDYYATLKKGTLVYQRATTSANTIKLTKKYSVKLCAVSGDWALVQTTGKKGMYGFVKVSKLTNLRVK